MSNWQLIEKTLVAIEDHPDVLNMEEWVSRFDGTSYGQPELCNTQMCFAGWVCYVAGDEFVWFGSTAAVRMETKGVPQITDIPSRARDLLGISQGVADSIFYEPYRNVTELREGIYSVLGRPDAT